MRGPSDLVLLFYDGFERQAESSTPLKLKAFARQHARWAWRTVRRKQVKTGYYTAFLNLCLALRRAGLDVRVNDFASARRYPKHPIGVCGYPTVFAKVEGLANPRIIGPGPYTSPTENPTLMSDPRNRAYMQRCQWMKDLFARVYGEDRLFRWYRGFDVSDFEDTRDVPKTNDVLIYDKIYHDREDYYARTIAPFIDRLVAKNLRYQVVRYGEYINQDYIAALRVSRCLAFFAHSETQGHAYQEAMAMNTPVFAWDEGVWLHPLAKELSDAPIACTSVPDFDERCGVRFRAENMLDAWDQFWPNLGTFRPRDFVAKNLSLAGSAELYMQAYRDAGAHLVAEAAPTRA